jgi:hypothetical protein
MSVRVGWMAREIRIEGAAFGLVEGGMRSGMLYSMMRQPGGEVQKVSIARV